jgi:hypothetical protein
MIVRLIYLQMLDIQYVSSNGYIESFDLIWISIVIC